MSASRCAGCVLCEGDGGRVVFATGTWRIVQADEAGFPAFYRVIWNAHVREWTDLAGPEREDCMGAVEAVERVLRRQLAPAKINLATLGNQVAHLHWHVIARFEWDDRFPAPVWAAPLRARDLAAEAELAARLPALERALVQHLSTRSS